jgi:hypothetical protein
MYLPHEVEDYRNKILANPPKIPAKIRDNWWSRIVPANLYILGEEGAYIYITKCGGKLGEKTLIHYALQAGVEKQRDMALGFWKRAYLKHSNKRLRADLAKTEPSQEPNSSEVTISLHEFWFTLLRVQKKYSCFSIFWVLPSDKEAIRYLTDFSEDLKIISRPSTLVMTLGSDQRLHADVDSKSLSVEIKSNIERIAPSFSKDFTKVPCLILFSKINSSDGTHVYLKGMTAEEISETMKVIFLIIQNAIKEKRSPIEALQRHQKDERLRHAGKAIIGTMRDLFLLTHRITIEALINQLNSP